MAHTAMSDIYQKVESAKDFVTVGAKYYHYKNPDKFYTVTGLVVLEEIHQAQGKIQMALDNLLAGGPISLRVIMIFPGQDRGVHMRFPIRAAVAADGFALVMDVFLPMVGGRFFGQDAIRGVAGNAEAVVIGLHRAIRREGTGGVNGPLL